MITQLSGRHGTAERVLAARFAGEYAATLDLWIITAPIWHPLWSQYMLGLVRLAEVPGVEPAKVYRPGATHELLVATLNPEFGPYTADTLDTSPLTAFPPNVAEQFTATDEQATQLTELLVRAVVDGHLIPETADAPDPIRDTWRATIHQTLDHFHDPHHGRMN